MSKFKIGNIIAVYSGDSRTVGIIEEINYKGLIKISAYKKPIINPGFVHPKQCRKLIKKTRTTIWINNGELHTKKGWSKTVTARLNKDDCKGSEWTEFIEVLKK